MKLRHITPPRFSIKVNSKKGNYIVGKDGLVVLTKGNYLGADRVKPELLDAHFEKADE